MNKVFFIFFSFIIVGCNANETFIDHHKPKFESMTFDVVQKKLVIEQELPDYVQTLVSSWFDEKVKIDGFDGDMKFIISDYRQEISSITDGKRVDISLSFEVFLKKPLLSKTKLIKGKVSSYGNLTGNYSLNEFDVVIQNTQKDLILRLSRDLKSKI